MAASLGVEGPFLEEGKEAHLEASYLEASYPEASYLEGREDELKQASISHIPGDLRSSGSYLQTAGAVLPLAASGVLRKVEEELGAEDRIRIHLVGDHHWTHKRK